MSSRHRDQTFRKTDVVRAYRAALTAGVPNPRIEIDITRRKISIVSGETITNYNGAINPWDEVLTNAADQKRPS